MQLTVNEYIRWLRACIKDHPKILDPFHFAETEISPTDYPNVSFEEASAIYFLSESLKRRLDFMLAVLMDRH